jgi:hypothetical protein
MGTRAKRAAAALISTQCLQKMYVAIVIVELVEVADSSVAERVAEVFRL